jgi:phosphoglycerate dehydrogenase-like enzyme
MTVWSLRALGMTVWSRRALGMTVWYAIPVKPPHKPRILLPEPLDADADARLEAHAVVVRPPALDEPTLCRCIADCDALVARTSLPIPCRLLEAGAGRLRVVGVAGVGVDRVDVVAAEELGIQVLNTPAAASDAVAEFTVEMMLMLLRPIPRLAAEYRAGRFAAARERPHGCELRELTVGIVGMGRIGARVGRICAAGFGARVLYNDIVPVGPFDFPAQPADKDALWSQADIITLHVPLTDLTRGLINAATLARFKRAALLVNAARGAVVDTAALTAALQSGTLAGAAVDVTHPEPLPPDHPLLSCQNCIVTPHVAARTYGGLRRMFDVVDDVLRALADSQDGRGRGDIAGDD